MCVYLLSAFMYVFVRERVVCVCMCVGSILFTMAFQFHPFQDGGNLQIISGTYTIPAEHPYSPAGSLWHCFFTVVLNRCRGTPFHKSEQNQNIFLEMSHPLASIPRFITTQPLWSSSEFFFEVDVVLQCFRENSSELDFNFSEGCEEILWGERHLEKRIFSEGI